MSRQRAQGETGFGRDGLDGGGIIQCSAMLCFATVGRCRCTEQQDTGRAVQASCE